MTLHPAESNPNFEHVASPEELAIRTLTETAERVFVEYDFSTEPPSPAFKGIEGGAEDVIQDKLFDMKTWTTIIRNTSEAGEVSYGFWVPGQRSSDKTGNMRNWRPGASSIIDVGTSELYGPSNGGQLDAAQIEAMTSRINEVFPPKVVEPKNILLRTLRRLIPRRK